MEEKYRICTHCIMDTTDPDIQFDQNGICNHCKRYDERVKNELYYNKSGQDKLKRMINCIKKEGKNNEYDCIVGVSGGVDSTFVAYKVKQLGLRPIAIHLDNGWDSELAVSNIEKVLKKLNIDLFTYVIDWEEYKQLQLAFLKASVVNTEVPSDHAILAFQYKFAEEKGIKYIIAGRNIVTEASLPKAWKYEAKDLRHLKSIQRQFSKNKLKSFPQLSVLRMAYYTLIKNIKSIPILNYIPYNKKEALNILKKELSWKYYGGKHYESIFTRFYQGYILPKKFNIDKRKAHLSSLICSGQISRSEALLEIKEDIYPPEQLREDKEYVIKKLGLNEVEFDEIMSLPIKSHFDYPNNSLFMKKLDFIVKACKKIATYN